MLPLAIFPLTLNQSAHSLFKVKVKLYLFPGGFLSTCPQADFFDSEFLKYSFSASITRHFPCIITKPLLFRAEFCLITRWTKIGLSIVSSFYFLNFRNEDRQDNRCHWEHSKGLWDLLRIRVFLLKCSDSMSQVEFKTFLFLLCISFFPPNPPLQNKLIFTNVLSCSDYIREDTRIIQFCKGVHEAEKTPSL